MSERIGQQLVKLNCRHERKKDAFVDIESGQQARFFRASGLRIEINLTRNDQIVDVGNFTSVTLEVKQGAARTGAVAMTKTVSPGAGLDASLTQDEHEAKTAGRAHFTFTFSDAETASGVFGASVTDDYECWAVVYGMLSDSGSRVILGSGTVVASNAGVSGAVVNPPSGGQAITYAEVQALLGSYVPFDVPAGKAIRFNEVLGGKAVRRTIGLTIDPDQGPQRQDDLEVEQ